MISTNIDGSPVGGANQLFDLLSVVSNPAEVKKRIADLQKAQADAEAVINLVGPAEQVIKFRDQAAKDKDAAAAILADAQGKADSMVASASTQAAAIIESANASVSNLLADAKAKNDAAAAAIAVVNKQQSDLKAAQDAIAQAAVQLNAQKADLAAQIVAAKKAQDNAEALKQEIIAKHKAFIESIA
jgi:hypothetical protein